MVDSQEQLSLKLEPTARTTGLLVVGAVVALFLLKKFSVSVAVGK